MCKCNVGSGKGLFGLRSKLFLYPYDITTIAELFSYLQINCKF